MKGSVLAIINPISGTRPKQELPAIIASTLGSDVRIIFTDGPGHATRIAAQAVAERCTSTIVAIGGDGTVNETARAMIDSDIPLAIVPCGSGNGLARHLHIPLNIEKALALVKTGTPLRCDTATANGHPFFCTMGVGFDAGVSKAFAEAPRRGLLTYAKIAMEQFLHYKPQKYRITAGDSTFTTEAFLIAACNASQYGNNAYIAPNADITDGQLDLTIIKEGNPAHLAIAGLRLFTKRLDQSPLIHSLRARHIIIERDAPGPCHLDGEAMQMNKRIDIDIVPQSLSIITPKT